MQKIKPYVISISGIAGSGKTTLANALREQLENTELVCFDDFPGDLLGRDYCEWSEAGADCNEWNLSPIIDKVQSLLCKPFDYIILDFPFGKAHKATGEYIDLAVWVDVSLDISLARRVLRDFIRRSQERRPLKGNTAEEVSSYLDFYLARHRDTYFRHIETVKPCTDLLVDGTKPIEEIVEEVFKFVIKETEKSK